MKLGLSIGYSKAHLDIPVKLVQRAEELGYDSVWSAEAYGSDAVTPLAYLAALTKRIRLGTGIKQLAARTPANAAMYAGTLDALAGGGRFIAGLGACRVRKLSKDGMASRGENPIIAYAITSRSCARYSPAKNR
jgi:alkanesulfonate monooxygenase SsuD/methylene tetrahydromethanopterin reductase-like flavin-dependent oxidoreductase (luciferase family)